jgi:hypothetical protein
MIIQTKKIDKLMKMAMTRHNNRISDATAQR